MSTLPVTSLLHSVQLQRKPKHRTTSLALFGLIVVSFYIFFIARPSLDLAPIALRTDTRGHADARVQRIDDENSSPSPSRLFRLPPKVLNNVDRPQLKLDESQELAAVAAFVAALPQNTIPWSIDPSQPIDPQLVLDFDTRNPRAADEVKQIVEEVWSRYPVMLFTKVRHSFIFRCRNSYAEPRYYFQLHHGSSREIRSMISNMNLRPSPPIFDVDQRGKQFARPSVANRSFFLLVLRGRGCFDSFVAPSHIFNRASRLAYWGQARRLDSCHTRA
jgi:hypothetical protein